MSDFMIVFLFLVFALLVYTAAYSWIFRDMWKRHRARMAAFDRMSKTIDEIDELIARRYKRLLDAKGME